jgi:phosphohistidine swiveling domain-containing protein
VPVLWLRFSDDASLPSSLTEAERRKLEEIYDADDEGSIWNRAAARLGLSPGGGKLLRWHAGAPYINWSLMTSIISCGSIDVVPRPDGGYSYVSRGTLRRLPALLKSQWRAAQYIERALAAPLPETQEEKLVESTALGLALQAIMLRLPKHTPQDLAGWLAQPDKAPPKLRQTILQMQAIQKRRTQLSPAWFELFPKREGEDMLGPEHFWNEPPPSTASPGDASRQPLSSEKMEWKGLPVCAGQVTGRVYIVRSMRNFFPPEMSDFPIFVFPRAKPETTELFPFAAALLFAEGGALSHACTIAREQGIPCITGLGQDFLQRLQELAGNGSVWMTIDGAAGTGAVTKTGNG